VVTLASSTPAVYGVRSTMAELRAIEPKLRTAAVKDVKAAARPLQDAVTSKLGRDAPLSGMRHKGRTGWYASGAHNVRTKYGGRRDRKRDEWPLLSVIITGAAGSIVDMAGRASSASSLARNLTSRRGSPSRAAWPAAEQHLQAVQAAVLVAVQEVQRQVNPRLNTVTKGP